MTAEEFLASAIPEPNTGCTLWERAINRHGYGVVRWQGKAKLAHRVAYMLCHDGHEPPAVIHRCDNPACVNPDHLVGGTQTQNLADMHRKGRGSGNPTRGDAHHRSKLTADVVRMIRASSEPNKALAERLGLSRDAVYDVRAGRTWSHIR